MKDLGGINMFRNKNGYKNLMVSIYLKIILVKFGKWKNLWNNRKKWEREKHFLLKILCGYSVLTKWVLFIKIL